MVDKIAKLVLGALLTVMVVVSAWCIYVDWR
jgi:hypothetical protein